MDMARLLLMSAVATAKGVMGIFDIICRSENEPRRAATTALV